MQQKNLQMKYLVLIFIFICSCAIANNSDWNVNINYIHPDIAGQFIDQMINEEFESDTVPTKERGIIYLHGKFPKCVIDSSQTK